MNDRDYIQSVSQYAPAVYRFLYSNFSHQEVCQSILTKTFDDFWDKVGSINVSKTKVWLFKNAYRRLIDHIRTIKKYTHTPQEFILFNYQSEAIGFTANDPLDKLKLKYKSIILLRDVVKCEFNEIAEILELDLSLAKTGLFRGRKRFLEVGMHSFSVDDKILDTSVDQWCFDYLENLLNKDDKKKFESNFAINENTLTCLNKWKQSKIESLDHIDFDRTLEKKLIEHIKTSNWKKWAIAISTSIAAVFLGVLLIQKNDTKPTIVQKIKSDTPTIKKTNVVTTEEKILPPKITLIDSVKKDSATAPIKVAATVAAKEIQPPLQKRKQKVKEEAPIIEETKNTLLSMESVQTDSEVIETISQEPEPKPQEPVVSEKKSRRERKNKKNITEKEQ